MRAPGPHHGIQQPGCGLIGRAEWLVRELWALAAGPASRQARPGSMSCDQVGWFQYQGGTEVPP